MTTAQGQGFSKIKEVVATWNNIRQLLRSGDQGYLVPVVIPKGGTRIWRSTVGGPQPLWFSDGFPGPD